MKKCSKCKEVKPFDEFHKSSSKLDGLKCHCKACRRKSRKKLYKTNKDKRGYYVYTHSIKENGEIFYIGSGCSNRAWDSHKRNKEWDKIKDEHGFPEVGIVKDKLSKRESLDLEQELQKKYKPRANFRYGAGKGERRGAKAGRARAVINCRNEVFETVADAARKYERTTSNISRACKGVINYSGKYPDGKPVKWKYHEK